MTTSYLSDEDMEFLTNFDLVGGDLSSLESINSDVFGSAPPMANESVATFSSKKQEVIEPVPIAQDGVMVVRTVPMEAAPWNQDETFLKSLRKLLTDEPSAPTSSLHVLGETTATSTSFKQTKIEDASGCGMVAEASPMQEMRNRNLSGVTKPDGVRSLVDESFSESDVDEDASRTSTTASPSSFRSSHVEQWNQRYSELVRFQKQHGHCLVPLNWPANPSLAHWVKRQRYQFRMKRDGKHSSLTEERERKLQSLGFVWDSHAAGWEERWNELRDFKERYGHCNVPKKYPENQQLAVWVKCQRRQFKLRAGGQRSNMTRGRIEKLQLLGFVFDPRSNRRRTSTTSFTAI